MQMGEQPGGPAPAGRRRDGRRKRPRRAPAGRCRGRGRSAHRRRSERGRSRCSRRTGRTARPHRDRIRGPVERDVHAREPTGAPARPRLGAAAIPARGGHNGTMSSDDRPWGGCRGALRRCRTTRSSAWSCSPRQRLSYQRHAHRAEHWFVVAGRGVVTLDGRPHAVSRAWRSTFRTGTLPTACRIRVDSNSSSSRSSTATASTRTTSSGWRTTTERAASVRQPSLLQSSPRA